MCDLAFAVALTGFYRIQGMSLQVECGAWALGQFNWPEPLELAPSNARGADSVADADKQANAGSGSVMPYQPDLGPQSAERDRMESLASTGCSLDASRNDSLPRERADNKRRR